MDSKHPIIKITPQRQEILKLFSLGNEIICKKASRGPVSMLQQPHVVTGVGIEGDKTTLTLVKQSNYYDFLSGVNALHREYQHLPALETQRQLVLSDPHDEKNLLEAEIEVLARHVTKGDKSLIGMMAHRPNSQDLEGQITSGGLIVFTPIGQVCKGAEARYSGINRVDGHPFSVLPGYQRITAVPQ